MRQVPQYLFIGNGRLARHLQHYFTQLKLNFTNWQRQETQADLARKLQTATHILVLISDHAILDFIKKHCANTKAILIHCSGALVIDEAYGAHPLMTFGTKLYDLVTYQKIPFIIDEHAPAFKDLLPGLPNHHQRLNRALKAKYHALCVLSGNFTCLLWQKLFQDFSQELQLAPELAHPYLQQQMQNLIADYPHALTGPLPRGDHATMAKNLEALANDPIQEVYKSFIKYYQERS